MSSILTGSTIFPSIFNGLEPSDFIGQLAAAQNFARTDRNIAPKGGGIWGTLTHALPNMPPSPPWTA